ncbi:MAG: hypothetical protein CMN55_09465 [Sneathiella sp.]|jgi:hypothetical protein|uniref:hypothetical protein n=1 Tax=Sneathiella sp. TaxID=1964365 RepID=UPI000C35F659|nr:hypothetical protein [Sneathiella sp.]MAL79324.1 hypothetical protein [Sneathiella sp.]
MQTATIVRPRQQLAPPVRLDPAFSDPEAVVDLIEKGSPYKTLSAVHKNTGETSGGWFRNFWALGGKVVFAGAEPFFHNPEFIAAAQQSFNAEVIRPVAMMTNLNLPAAGLPPHQDLPFFRGAQNREVPSWMLAPMGYSTLFHDWAIPVASAITWFYDGEGGEFEYWPDGFEAPSKTERPPYSNCCVLADNEYMFHRVGAVGPEAEHDLYTGLGHHARLILTEAGHWQVEDEGRIVAELEYSKVRLSVLWKGYCFRDGAEAAAYDDHSRDLTTDLIIDIFRSDLAARGIQVKRPEDFWTDAGWKETITTVYGPPSGY